MQNIPVRGGTKEVEAQWAAMYGKKEEDFKLRYRNAFVCAEGESYVDADYAG